MYRPNTAATDIWLFLDHLALPQNSPVYPEPPQEDEDDDLTSFEIYAEEEDVDPEA